MNFPGTVSSDADSVIFCVDDLVRPLDMGFEVVTAAENVTITVFLDVTPCSWVHRHRPLRIIIIP